MKNWIVFLYFLGIPCLITAQIAPGDIAVIGINGVPNNRAEVTIVTLADIPANSVIHVTDVPYDNGLSAVTNNDGIITWTTPASTLPAGTVVMFDFLFNANGIPTINITPSTGVGSITTSGWTLSLTLLTPFGNGTGENIFIYTGAANNPTFIYGFINSLSNGQTNGGGSGEWFNTLLTSANRSALPPTLVNSNGSNVATAHALNGSQHADSHYYTGTRTGTRDDLLIEIGKDQNWNGSSSVQDITPGGSIFSGSNPIFMLGSACNLAASITSSSNVSCTGAMDGSLTVTATNGASNFSYAWSNGTTNNGISSTSNTLSGLSGGTYSVIVTDANGCTATASAMVNEATALLTLSIAATNVSCNGNMDGAANLTLSGGQAAFNFSWSDGSAVIATTEDLSGLPAGTYTVTVTDAYGCIKNAQTTITQPAALNAGTVLTN